MSEQPGEVTWIVAGDDDPAADSAVSEDAVEGTTEDGTPVVSEFDSEADTAS